MTASSLPALKAYRGREQAYRAGQYAAAVGASREVRAQGHVLLAHLELGLATGGQARLFATGRVTILVDGTQLFDEERVRLTPL